MTLLVLGGIISVVGEGEDEFEIDGEMEEMDEEEETEEEEREEVEEEREGTEEEGADGSPVLVGGS